MKTPLSTVPIVLSVSCQTASEGISAGPPAESAPTAVNTTSEPGVTYWSSVFTDALTNLPSFTAFEITRMPPRVARWPPSEGLLFIVSSPEPERSEINVEEPPPSQFTASTQPRDSIISASSLMDVPAEYGG